MLPGVAAKKLAVIDEIQSSDNVITSQKKSRGRILD
jgi:hypothetical protein